MSLLSNLLPTAQAATTTVPAHHGQGNPMSSFIFLALIIAVFYFLLWRPQSKRAKAQRALIANLKVGDEVITTAGMLGRVNKITDTLLAIELAEGVIVQMQKNAITGVVPKGTLAAS